MLVVIGIICLIAAVLTPNVMNQLGRARARAAQLQLDTVATSVEQFRADVGRYPTQQEGLGALVSEPSGSDGWTGPYMKDPKALKDPWGHAILYSTDNEGQSFYVQSLGADGKAGGSGQDRDLRAPASSSGSTPPAAPAPAPAAAPSS
jgi:general secretion pathway protein G